MVLKTCQRQVCTNPWRQLHPDGTITSLKMALHSRFDEFYETQPHMFFTECPLGYFLDTENQTPVNSFSSDLFTFQGPDGEL